MTHDAILRMMRERWRAILAEERRRGTSLDFLKQGFLILAVPLISRIEDCSGGEELWQVPGFEEKNLTPQTRIGEHIAITRRVLGMLP
jgi:hypothetical protein